LPIGADEVDRVIAPLGTIVNARPPAAVAGGNVETSQRIVDTLLRALARAIPSRIPAASQGTMNNLSLGGLDRRHGSAPFAYYETIGGGAGGGPGRRGASATQSHMTNTLNTPTEVLEHAYPVRVPSVWTAQRFRWPRKIQRRRRDYPRNRNACRYASGNSV